MNSATLTDSADDLRKRLHEEIDRADTEQLEMLRRVLLQIEVFEAVEQLDRDFDADEAAGRLTPEKIEQAIREVRAGRRLS